MCPSCIINNFFKCLLLPNGWANLNQTWQDCSLESPLQKLFTEFDPFKNSGYHSNKMEFFQQFFKNILLWNYWSDFEIISQECSLSDPFQKLFAKFWSVQNMALVNGGFLHYTDMKKFLKKSFLIPLVRFWNNFTGVFLAWPFLKIVCEILIHA